MDLLITSIQESICKTLCCPAQPISSQVIAGRRGKVRQCSEWMDWKPDKYMVRFQTPNHSGMFKEIELSPQNIDRVNSYSTICQKNSLHASCAMMGVIILQRKGREGEGRGRKDGSWPLFLAPHLIFSTRESKSVIAWLQSVSGGGRNKSKSSPF